MPNSRILSHIDHEERHGLLAHDAKTSPDHTETDTLADDGQQRLRAYYNSRLIIIISILVLSLATNAITLTLILSRPNYSQEPPSKYANLHRTQPQPYVLLTDYSSPNATLSDTLWHSINIDHGVVALPDSFAASHNLRTAQRFPWDTSKGIYILHGFHNLHCLKIIYISLWEYRTAQPQSRSWHHIAHCLDALRRQILCDADDTPRATERRVEVVSGVGQHRVCRDWGELERWAREHTACYKRPERPGDEVGLRRFMHCPEGSGYVVDEGYEPAEAVVSGLPEESIATGIMGWGI
ncbi:hypothetical protein BJY00DRAFT_287158 [Aspergillus carlsbadensis]|nr:hypothetical protein BJY00DRAFT_287158 [Aspergillus carlsbadensis]